MTILIGPESPARHAAIRRLHLEAFPTPAEADLVERLRADGDAWLGLVAQEAGEVVGHAMLSRMRAPAATLGLAPLAVALGRQRQGIGSRLVQAAIARARADGRAALVVLGDPALYARFGFDAQAAAGFASPYAGPYLMLLVLDEALLDRSAGRLDHARAFDALA